MQSNQLSTCASSPNKIHEFIQIADWENEEIIWECMWCQRTERRGNN